MTPLWLGMLALCSLCIIVFIWPLWRAKNIRIESLDVSRDDANVSLYREHLAELDVNLAAGDIDTNTHELLKVELQRNLLADQANQASGSPMRTRGRWLLVVGMVVLVLASLLLYLRRGYAADIYLQQIQESYAKQDLEDSENNLAPNPARTYELIRLIRERLKAVPDNDQYWYLLALYAMHVSDYPLAIEGYKEVYRLNPTDAGNVSSLAQAIFLKNGNRMSQEILDTADEALRLDPRNSTALGLKGIHAYESEDYPNAVSYWTRAAAELPDLTSGKLALLSGVQRAQAAMASNAPSEAGLEPDSPTPAWSLPVTVSLDASLSPIEGTLFVFVRRWKGPPMPLVVTRIPGYKLPMSVVLDETMAMIDKNQLIDAGQVELVARISRRGTALPEAGDLEGHFGPFDINQLPESVELLIDRKL